MSDYNFFPKICPACGSKLVIEYGKTSDIIKLMCKNDACEGKSLKRLQKGIIQLEIRGLGPKIIEKLFDAGINSSVDLFNPTKFNEEILIKSGEFKKGRALEKIIDEVSKVKEIPINKAILSLQLQVKKENGDGEISIGKSLSEQIGKLLSGVDYDFTGLSRQVRDEINNHDSWLYKTISNSIKSFEENGIKIIRYSDKPKTVVKTKRAVKKIDFTNESSLDISNEEIVEELGWEKVECPGCDFLVTDETEHPKIKTAKDNGIKVLTYRKFKLLFL